MKEIVWIDIKAIYPHPDNPRKELGTLTELTESIKKNGIMQNLTVVPHAEKDGKFTVVIGHRRLAAARAAGLKTVPCIVSDMDERQQICTMLEENMQRTDLTIPEQAYGFQMMLDLGETAKSISEKTGFAETTVRHRLEIAKLDRKILETNLKGEGNYQLGINDLIELEKIKDIETRNKLVKDAYSHADLVGKIEAAVIKEKNDAAMEKLQPMLEANGVVPRPKSIYDWSLGVEEVIRIDLNKKLPESLDIPGQPEGTKIFWHIGYNRQLIISKKEKDASKEKTEEDLKREEEAKRCKSLKEKANEQKDGIRKFIKLIDDAAVRPLKDETDTVKGLWDAVMECGLQFDAYDIFKARAESAYGKTDEEKTEIVQGFLQRKLSVQMAVLLGQEIGSYRLECISFSGEYREKEGKQFLRIIKALEDLYGFRPAKELLQIADGTHELYRK